jgi:2'-5' RNA ligase
VPFTTLVVPTPEAEAAVSEARTRYDVWARRGFPAHVTVAGPFLPVERVDEPTLARLRELVAAHAATRFSLAQMRFLPGVVLLVPEPRDPFGALRHALEREWPEIRRIRPLGARLVGPHLTVARTLDPRAVRRLRRVIAPHLPIVVDARELHLVTLTAPAEVTAALPFARA